MSNDKFQLVHLQDYMSGLKKVKRRKSAIINWALHVERDEQDKTTFRYWVSDGRLLETKGNLTEIVEELLAIIASISEDDPSLALEAYQKFGDMLDLHELDEADCDDE